MRILVVLIACVALAGCPDDGGGYAQTPAAPASPAPPQVDQDPAAEEPAHPRTRFSRAPTVSPDDGPVLS